MNDKPEVDVASAVILYRPAAGEERSVTVQRAKAATLYAAAPFRTFRWYLKQRHYSGWYWCATEHDHVIHESKLELACLMFADFNTAVHHIVAQPFMLRTYVNGKIRRHTLDYLLDTDNGPVVVDVIRSERLAKPEIQLLCAWTGRIIESLGWSYVVFTDPPPEFLTNVRFLSGYRRDWLINKEVLADIRASTPELVGMSFRRAEGRFVHHPAALVRSALLHLLWRQELVVDLTRPLSPNTILDAPA